MNRLEIFLLGSFKVLYDGTDLTNALRTRKERALLAYLAEESAQPHPREAIAEFFWPDRPENYARMNLRQALLGLRKAFNAGEETTLPIIQITEETAQAVSRNIRLDTHTFYNHIQFTKSHPHEHLHTCQECIHHLEGATELYRGDFLDGFILGDLVSFQEWIVFHRERYFRTMLDTLHTLSKIYGLLTNYDQAYKYAWRYAYLAPLEETAHRLLMRILTLSGRRNAALQQYQLCKTLIEKELTRSSGSLTTRRYADLMDRFIRALFLEAAFRDKAEEIHESGVAVAALGSYGRRELCLGSDVDLLVIHQGRLSHETSEMIRRVLYTLWDVKLEVGHSVLTFQECNRLALSDFRFLTSVMDARFLLGARDFYRLFEAAFWSKIEREKETIRRQFLLYQQKRQEKFGTQEYFLEPDIKEGLGGLRDIHFMAWAAKLYFKSKQLRDVKRFSVFSHFGLDKLHESESFLLKVRNQLHLLAGGRREDRLLLPHQPKIAKSLGFKNGAFNTGPEKFMRDLHGHLNRIRYRSEEFHLKAMELIDPQPEEPTPEEISSAFQAVKGHLVLKGEELSPLLVLKALDEANRRGLSLGSGLIWAANKKIEEQGKTIGELSERLKNLEKKSRQN